MYEKVDSSTSLSPYTFPTTREKSYMRGPTTTGVGDIAGLNQILKTCIETIPVCEAKRICGELVTSVCAAFRSSEVWNAGC